MRMNDKEAMQVKKGKVTNMCYMKTLSLSLDVVKKFDLPKP